jgi:hypothetical protein
MRQIAGAVAPWTALLVLLAPAVGVAQDVLPAGVVVTLGGLPVADALAGAEATGGARFRGETIAPAAEVAPGSPTPAIDGLRRLYLDGDFLRCLTAMQSGTVEIDRLLADGLREDAGRAAVFQAACAYGAGDESLADAVIRRLFIAGLDASALVETTPEFQALAERAEAAVIGRTEAEVHLATRPAQAAVQVDGVPVTCGVRTCSVSLRPGRHVVRVERLGFSPRTVHVDVEGETRRTIALDPAPADEIRAQLARAVASADPPDKGEFIRAVADAFGARVVVLVWGQTGPTRAAVFDRAMGRVVSRASVDEGDSPVRTAAATAVSEWRGLVEPTTLVEEPLFWITTVGVAAAAGVAVFLLTQPEERHYVLAVP